MNSSPIPPDVLPKMISFIRGDTLESLRSWSCVCKAWNSALAELHNSLEVTLPEYEGYVLQEVIKGEFVKGYVGAVAYKLEVETGERSFGFAVWRSCEMSYKMDVMLIRFEEEDYDSYVLLIVKRVFEGLTVIRCCTWCFDCDLLEKSKKDAVIEAYSETFENGKSTGRVELDWCPRIFYRRDLGASNCWEECDDE